jgi:hypothetical protein
MDMVTRSIRYNGGADCLESELVSAIENTFGAILCRLQKVDEAGCFSAPGESERIAEAVARTIAGYARFADREKNAEGIHPRILEFVRRGIPIEAQMLWSPEKHWACGNESEVDLAELAALQTLLSVYSAVRKVYPAGLFYWLDLEDIEFEFMEAESKQLTDERETYISGLKLLVAALRLGDVFKLRRISERARNPDELMQWRCQMVENHHVLKSFWDESQGSPATSLEELPSCRKLRDLGWVGTIPPEMRSYYLNRLGKLAGTADERTDMVLRNLAGILLHHQVGLLRGSSILEPVKFSFVRPADAAPAQLLPGRVDLRFVPRRVCSRVSAAAPWSTKGFLCRHRKHLIVIFRGRHELAGAEWNFDEGWFTLEGTNGSAVVRADFLHS